MKYSRMFGETQRYWVYLFLRRKTDNNINILQQKQRISDRYYQTTLNSKLKISSYLLMPKEKNTRRTWRHLFKWMSSTSDSWKRRLQAALGANWARRDAASDTDGVESIPPGDRLFYSRVGNRHERGSTALLGVWRTFGRCSQRSPECSDGVKC